MSKIKVGLVCAALIGVMVAWKFLPVNEWLQSACDLVESWGPWGPVAYFAIYTGLVLVAFPNTPLNIGAGILFGLAVGFPVTMAAGVTGSCLCFLFSRYAARDWISSKVDDWNGRWLTNAVDRGGFKIMLLARLNPFLPSSVKDYGFGVTGVPFWKYALATLIGQAPIMFTYVYLGWTGAVTLTKQSDLGVWQYVMIGCGIVFSVALAAILAWYSRSQVEPAAA